MQGKECIALAGMDYSRQVACIHLLLGKYVEVAGSAGRTLQQLDGRI